MIELDHFQRSMNLSIGIFDWFLLGNLIPQKREDLVPLANPCMVWKYYNHRVGNADGVDAYWCDNGWSSCFSWLSFQFPHLL